MVFSVCGATGGTVRNRAAHPETGSMPRAMRRAMFATEPLRE